MTELFGFHAFVLFILVSPNCFWHPITSDFPLPAKSTESAFFWVSCTLITVSNDSSDAQLLNPGMDIHTHQHLLSAVRLLVSEDHCEGRFVFGRQVFNPSKPSVMASQPPLVPRVESGPGGDNSKSQLQTLLTRAGYTAPTYKTKQLKNSQFRATVEFNGMQIMGQPCSNKKSAEKDAAAEALQWLMGGIHTGHDFINNISMLLKRSKMDQYWNGMLKFPREGPIITWKWLNTLEFDPHVQHSPHLTPKERWLGSVFTWGTGSCFNISPSALVNDPCHRLRWEFVIDSNYLCLKTWTSSLLEVKEVGLL